MPVAEQAAVIFAGNQGFIDDIDVERVAAFREGLRDHLRSQNAGLLASIAAEKELSADHETQLREAITAYHNSFAPEVAAAVVEAEV